MTESKVAGGSSSEPTGLTSPGATFEKMKDLLKAKDDTSRFVGLALLKSVLDNEQQLVNNIERLQILWESISSKFLDRLLRAQLGGNVDKSQAKDMVDLAVAVLHTFSILLPENIRREPQLTRRIGPLVKALVQSSPETTQLILQTLLTIALPRNPKWLKSITTLLRDLVNRKPTLIGRTAYTQAAAALLQAYPATCPSLLFSNESLHTSDKTDNSKPFSYLFVNLLLIDLRSSFPSLLAKLNNSDYSAISQRLAAAFDVISSFIGYLVRSLDEDSNTSNMTPDLMLKLRKDIAETMSLAIEYLRDRWDASIAGASGLHPSARSGTAATSEGTRLTLTWDSMKDNVTADPLILASIRALAIWTREDENENLRKESAGMMDMFIELYKLRNKDEPDFRYPVLLALEGIMTTEDGVEAFLNQDGWQVVSEDLASIVSKSTDISSTNNYSIITSEAARGLQIVRVLLAVIDEESTSYIKQEWLTIFSTTSSMQLPSSTSPSVVIELHIAMLQLSTALLSKAGDSMQKRYANDQKSLVRIVQQLEVVVGEMEDKGEAAEFKELLSDVVLDLKNLGGR
ncbi:hypothetical protein SS1G_08833 [Sclerotinia sclerotiorum 1980 UF-70]|uniref:DUF1941 family protein n=1 Tax=Sclerotinia sclerotiorum (strain ATCC 18683 / 1980 / Ss-1) TaxID=665079 RepID=A7EU26_SCLS1|nr:hypothetical protein SS1G_08833 [Sclerotinia sclerotiorum 1980 UF-70]EDN92968.1 hypothetical protein SS1G_08833 [Sclerotinia sclerotiorum 1980 UF-70]